MWYADKLAENLIPDKTYSRAQIYEILADKKQGFSKNSFNWIMDSLLEKDFLERTSRNEYRLLSDMAKKKGKYAPIFSNQALRTIGILEKRFPAIEFVCFESVHLNEFLNHMIAKNTIFIQTERDVLDSVFHYLQDENIGNVLPNPSIKEWDSYWSDNCIVLLNLTSEAPKNHIIPHSMSIEQLLVDIISEKILKLLFSTSELYRIYSKAERNYYVDMVRLNRYARRRGKADMVKIYTEDI